MSLDSALAVFRRDLAPLTELEHAERSMTGVVQRFTKSLEQSDTAGFRSLVMSRREFAYLYYPASALTRYPTKQEPGLAWFLHQQQSQKGATRSFNRYGGNPVRIIQNACAEPRREQGANRLWGDCVQTVVNGRDTVTLRLFGGVYERNGRFKFFSYANDF